MKWVEAGVVSIDRERRAVTMDLLIDIAERKRIERDSLRIEEPESIAKEKFFMGEGRILVMDDEKYIRDLAGEMLSSVGYKVSTTIDGAEAIELYKEAMESGEPFDVVITDLTIPDGMGGKETIQKLMGIDPEVKVIVSSGYSDDPVMANFREHGFKGVIAKPYEIEELIEVLHQVAAGNAP